MSFHHSNVILSIIAHSVIISSFLCHSNIAMSFNHSYVIPPFICLSIIPLSSHHSKIKSGVIPSFERHSIIWMSSCKSSFLTHFDFKTSFRCHPIIWMSFNHLKVILPLQRHPSNHSSWRQNTVIWMSFHSFNSHLVIGMTGNDTLLGWQEWY